jgi:hypothetical protein
MSGKSPITLSRSLFPLAAAAATLIAGQAAGGNKPTQPLTPGACVAAGIKPLVGIVSAGSFQSPSTSNVKFQFLVYDWDWRCRATNVKMTWFYHIADKATKVNVDTVHGSENFPQIFQQSPGNPAKTWQKLYVSCIPKGVSTYCKDSSATIAPSSNYIIKSGQGSKSVGPLAP